MKNCVSCIFWEKWKEKNNIEHHGENIGQCYNRSFVYTGQGRTCPQDGLGYWDCEDYSAGFETGKDFGCIHWEKK